MFRICASNMKLPITENHMEVYIFVAHMNYKQFQGKCLFSGRGVFILKNTNHVGFFMYSSLSSSYTLNEVPHSA